jgi:hypothetical protein
MSDARRCTFAVGARRPVPASGADELTVRNLLGDLSELGYVEQDTPAGGGEPRVWLTAEGFAMAHIAERVVLARFAEQAAPAGAPAGRAGG